MAEKDNIFVLTEVPKSRPRSYVARAPHGRSFVKASNLSQVRRDSEAEDDQVPLLEEVVEPAYLTQQHVDEVLNHLRKDLDNEVNRWLKQELPEAVSTVQGLISELLEEKTRKELLPRLHLIIEAYRNKDDLK